MVEKFALLVSQILNRASAEGRLIENPSEAELRSMAEGEPGVRRTVYDSLVADSEPTSRAAAFTQNSVDHPFDEEELQLLAQCEEAMSRERLILLDRVVGQEDNVAVRLILPQKLAHVAYGGGKLLSPSRGTIEEPTHHILMFSDSSFESNKTKPLPQKDITIRLAMLDESRVIKIVRNSTYIGEYKKGVFAAEDWRAKSRGGIFLHAGCREDYLQAAHGNYCNTSSLVIALSASGKTSITCRILARKGREKSWVVQDDGGTLMPDGSFHGFEGGGIYVKTEGLNPGDQTEIYYSLLKPHTFVENVHVDESGYFNFMNLKRTSNGRAVVCRRDMMQASGHIDVERVDNLIMIARGPIIPAIAKLTPEQAVAFMILGQSMESSAGDPTQAGKLKSVFFYDPFMAGSKEYHARRFYEILKGLPHINCYVINTAGVGEGEGYQDIKLEHTMNIMDSLIREGLEDWVVSPVGLKVPMSIRNVDSIYVHPEDLYSEEKFELRKRELWCMVREAVEGAGESLAYELQRTLDSELENKG